MSYTSTNRASLNVLAHKETVCPSRDIHSLAWVLGSAQYRAPCSTSSSSTSTTRGSSSSLEGGLCTNYTGAIPAVSLDGNQVRSQTGRKPHENKSIALQTRSSHMVPPVTVTGIVVKLAIRYSIALLLGMAWLFAEIVHQRSRSFPGFAFTSMPFFSEETSCSPCTLIQFLMVQIVEAVHSAASILSVDEDIEDECG